MPKILRAALFFVCSVFVFAQNPLPVQRELDFSIRDSVDLSGSKYIGYAGALPSVFTFVNEDGSISVCAADERARETFVYEYTKDMKPAAAVKIKNEFTLLGAFTKDSAGNYYFFFAENAGKAPENMAVVKYGKDGIQQKIYKLKTTPENSFSGVNKPFDAGTCRLELSGNMLAVYFARLMFNGHQASYGFVLNKDTFERVDNGAATNDNEQPRKIMPYVSHSFNQFIVPVENGFVFADHGDANPRCFTFAKFQTEDRTKRLNSFNFTGSKGQNATFAEMGGLAKTQSGFIFAGTYGNGANSPRNLFILTLKEDLSTVSAPLYLTKYTRQDGHAAHPKITALDSGRYLLLWEQMDFSTQSANQIVFNPTGFKAAYMMIIDENGKELSAAKKLPEGVRLNMNDTLRYNKTNGNVCWSVNAGNKSFVIWTLQPDKELNYNFNAAMFNRMEQAAPEDFKYAVKGKKGEEQTITITKYTGFINNVIIPNEIDGLPVTVIGKEAFGQMPLTNVQLPEKLRAIEDQAFWGSSLKSLSMPETLETIGKQAFSFCDGLVKVVFSKNIKSVKEFAFLSCANLTEVIIPAGNDMQLGYGAFDKCAKLNDASKTALSKF